MVYLDSVYLFIIEIVVAGRLLNNLRKNDSSTAKAVHLAALHLT